MVGNGFIQLHVQSQTVPVCRRVCTSSIILSQRIPRRSRVEDAGKCTKEGSVVHVQSCCFAHFKSYTARAEQLFSLE